MKKLIGTTIFIGLVIAGINNIYAQNTLTTELPNQKLVASNSRSVTERKEEIFTAEYIAEGRKQGKVVVITGNRFSYPLLQKWIDDYNITNPDVQIIIESRGSSDPLNYDILSEVYEQSEDVKKTREYIHVARYAVLPVANSKSAFAKSYSEKGFNRDLINQLFFHDITADKDKQQKIKDPFTIYTRMQKAGAPIVFSKHFGYEQKDIKGKSIAGSDEHLLKALLRDSTSVSILPLPLIYNHATKKPIDGLTVLPVDVNDNGRVSNDEKFYTDLSTVIDRLEAKSAEENKNIPSAYLHLSVSKQNASLEAIEFLKWVINNGQKNLHDFGFMTPEPERIGKEKFEQYCIKFINP